MGGVLVLGGSREGVKWGALGEGSREGVKPGFIGAVVTKSRAEAEGTLRDLGVRFRAVPTARSGSAPHGACLAWQQLWLREPHSPPLCFPG